MEIEKRLKPYNLAQQVVENTKQIAANVEDIDGLYQVINTIPDVSGFYTIEQTDTLLMSKLEKENINTNINQTASFGYTDNSSPSIKKVDLTTNKSSELRILTTGIYTVNEEGGVILPDSDAAITPKLYVDNLNNNLVEQINNITNGTTPVVLNSSNIIDNNSSNPNEGINPWKNQIDINIEDINDLKEQKAEKSDLNNTNMNVTENTNSINTLNSLVKQSFQTFGSYTSPNGEATNETIRPILTANIPLDEEFVVADVTPEVNNFLNLTTGKIIFTISLSNLKNEGPDIANLKLNIYYNEDLVEAPNVDIPVAWSGSRTVTGALNVEENSTVYVTFEVTGSLSVDAPVQYNIEFQNNQIVSSPSSIIVNDKIANPSTGINPDLNNIDINASSINNIINNLIPTLQNQITSLQTSLTNSYLPIGSIIISPTVPPYGTWSNLGELKDGQSIIGGNSSNGNVASHNHQWASVIALGDRTDGIGGIGGITTYNSDGSKKTIADITPEPQGTAYTANTGMISLDTGPINLAYGLGLGTNLIVWKRTS